MPSSSSFVALAIVILVGLSVAFVGGTIALVGRRGRRTDDHPLCRRCGFDLTGRPATSDRCPECGADLAAARAIVVGHRVPRRAWMTVGLTLVALGVGATILASLIVGPQVDWQAAKPAWWLLRESRSSSRATRDAALDALCNRSVADRVNPLAPQLGSANERLLIARLLEVQADATLPWKPWWGDGIAARIEDGTLPAAERDAFLRAIFASPTLSVRPDVRAGDGLPMALKVGGRGPQNSRLAARFDRTDERTFLDGRPTAEPPAESGSWSQSSLGNGSLGNWSDLNARWLADLAPGVHTVEQRTTVRIRTGFEDDAREIFATPIRASAAFTIHPRDATLVTFVTDESMRPAIEAAFARASVRLNDARGSATVDVNTPQGGRLPTPIAFAITLRQADRTWRVGSMSTRSTSGSWGFGTRCEGLKPGVADLIFTSDAAAAADTIDVTTAWQGEVIVKDVPVKREP